MKIVGVSVRHEGAHKLVTVTGQFTDAEHVEADDVARLVDLVKEAAGRQLMDEEAPKTTTALGTADDAASVSGRRRRHENKLGNPEAGGQADETPTETPAPSASAGSRRRRERAAPSADAGQTESERQPEAPTGSSQGNGRRRRQRAADPTDTTERASNAAGDGQSRRRAASTAETKSRSKDDEISDMDLAKAASHAVQFVLPSDVTALLEEYGVKKVNALGQGKRRYFLNDLEKLVAAAGKGKK